MDCTCCTDGQSMADLVNLLYKYQGIYNFKMTEFFARRAWEVVEPEWLEALSSLDNDALNQVPFGSNATLPESLTHFIQKTLAFSLPRNPTPSESDPKLSSTVHKGMSPKKYHEVTRMSAVIADMCHRANCNAVVDVGSGLGYLGQVINLKTGLKVLGLEGKEKRTSSAMLRAEKHDISTQDLETVNFHINNTPGCNEAFNQILVQKLSHNNRHTVNKDAQGTDLSNSKNIKVYKNKDCEILDPSTRLTSPLPTTNAADCTLTISSEKICAEPSVTCDNNSFIQESSQSEYPVDSLNQSSQRKAGDIAYMRQDQIETEPVLYVEPALKVCMVGLHCCGPLTSHMIRLAMASPHVAAFVGVGCCYHSTGNDKSNTAVSPDLFPMSSAMNCILSELSQKSDNSGNFINIYALRLAAQETKERWRNLDNEQHEFHIKNVAYRNILDVFLNKYNYTHELKRHRKLARKKDYQDFSTFLDAIMQRTSLLPAGLEESFVREEMWCLYHEFEKYFKYIEGFTLLQMLLQPVLECLIIKDRLHFILESGATSVESKALFDSVVSPRNLAILFRK